MSAKRTSRRDALRLLGAAACAVALVPRTAAAASEFPGDSIYQFRPPLTDQDGQSFDLASLHGHPVLASMFYSSCAYVCPMIFETIRQTVNALAPPERERVRILMISLDPTRDTSEVLKRTAGAHGCNAHWTLARTDDANTRKIAALLGVQYRRLPSGEFNHSTAIELLDADGRIAARSTTLGSVDPNLLRSLRGTFVSRG